MPVSYSRIKIGQKGFRALCGKLILEKCGKKVNIEKGAVFSTNVELGNNSGIGINAKIHGKCIIGDDVMMGLNASFIRETISLMMYQNQ